MALLSYLSLYSVFMILCHCSDIRCQCDDSTTTGGDCVGKVGSLGECECREAFDEKLFRFSDEDLVVFCKASNLTGIRCYCDNRSAFRTDQTCEANVHTNGLVTFARGCQCAHPMARPEIVPEYIYNRVFIVRCVWHRAIDSNDSSRLVATDLTRRKRDILTESSTEASYASTGTSTSTSTPLQTTAIAHPRPVREAQDNSSTSSTWTSSSSTATSSSTSTTSVSTVTGSSSSSTTSHSTSTHSLSSTSTSRTSTHKTSTTHSSTSSSSSTTKTTSVSTTASTSRSTSSSTHTSTTTTASTSTSTPSTTTTKLSSNTTTSNVTTSISSTAKVNSTTITSKTSSTTAESSSDSVEYFGTSNVTEFTSNNRKIAKYLLYAGSGWVVFWICLTILMNVCFGVVGHHRFLDLFQEVCLIVFFAFLGVFTFEPQWSICKANKAVLQALIMCILLIAIMQALFLSSLNKGRSSKNSRLPVGVNYVWPPFVAAVTAVICYFILKSSYDSNGVHCLCEIYERLYWVFAFPAGILYFLALLTNQMAISACKMSKPNVDKVQLYWAKRTMRAMPVLMFWFLSCFFCLVFAVDMQKIWLVGVFLGLSVIFGPMLFVFHTYCYEKSRERLFNATGLSFYKPCPTKKGDPNHVEAVVEKTDLRKRKPTGPAETVEPPPKPVEAIQTTPVPLDPLQPPAPSAPTTVAAVDPNPTSAQDFYNWLTDGNDQVGQAENVLFKKTM